MVLKLRYSPCIKKKALNWRTHKKEIKNFFRTTTIYVPYKSKEPFCTLIFLLHIILLPTYTLLYPKYEGILPHSLQKEQPSRLSLSRAENAFAILCASKLFIFYMLLFLHFVLCNFISKFLSTWLPKCTHLHNVCKVVLLNFT